MNARAPEHRSRIPGFIAGQVNSSATMTVPHYISENQSDMRGIKHGWYAIEDDGNLSSGPFPSFEECLTEISRPANGTMAVSCNKGRTEHFSKPVYRHRASRAAPGGLLKPAL